VIARVPARKRALDSPGAAEIIERVTHDGRKAPAPGLDVARAPTDAAGPDAGQPAVRVPQVGARVKHYELLRELGAGGMGTVYLARDTTLGRLVAIKVLQRRSDASAERFLVEAQATARCRHENIVVIHEVGELDGYPYMVLEHLEGRTLREWMAREAAFVSPSLAVELMLPVVRALACAHSLGIVHRDLKPENIFLTSAGRVVVLDFGIAKQLDAEERSALHARVPSGEHRLDSRLTQEGALIGTLPYMSPEQLRAEDIDARSDLWTVGIILFELVTGAHPLPSCSPAALLALADSDEPMPGVEGRRPDIGALGAIIDRCLRKPPSERYRSADELLAALEALDSGRPRDPDAEVSPFAGLSAFQEADAERYLGRQREVVALLERLRNQPLGVVVGPSGAGKSSFVRAGLIPALKRSGERWEALILRPGPRPLAALAELLAQAAPAAPAAPGAPAAPDTLEAQPGRFGARLRERCRREGDRHRILVFVDQFEELYTLGADAAERAAFVACLEGAADDASSPLRVVLSIRADFLYRMAEEGHFLAESVHGLFFLRPMGRAGLREALVQPLLAAGYRFESDAMIEAIIAELERTRSPLPLLQFAAAKLWEARDRAGRLVTQASYDQLGGVAGALSAHADAVLAGLSPAEQRLCRAVFLRLCTSERTRAVVSLADLRALSDDGDAVERVIQRLADARLVLIEAGGEPADAANTTALDVTIELSHESLIESWDKLRLWLSESEQDARLVARLVAAARQWEASGQAEGLLWRDHAAREAADWLARRRAEREGGQALGLGAREERFLRAVVALSQRARRRRQRIVAGALATASAVTAVVIGLSIAASRQAARADHAAVRADLAAARAEEEARSSQVEARQARNATRMAIARALEQQDPTAMLVLLREIEPPGVPQGWADLASRALRSGLVHEVRRWGERAYGAAWSPDGRRAVVALHDGTARIWRVGDPAAPIVLRGHTAHLWSAAFSPDGTRVVTGSGDGTARVWRADGTGAPIVLRGHAGSINTALFSGDGARIVTASDDGTARVWRADGTGAPIVLRGHTDKVTSAAFRPDGQRIVTSSDDGTARVWRADGTGAPVVLRGHASMVETAAFSPDGRRVVTGSADMTARVWNADGTGAPVVLRGHEYWVKSAVFSADGARILTASKDKTVRVWNADGRGAPVVLRGHDNWIYTAAWSPDGASIITASLDKTTRLFRIDLGSAPVLLHHNEWSVPRVSWSHGGRRLMTLDDSGTVWTWRPDGTGPLAVLRTDGNVDHFALSPDGQHIAKTSKDHEVLVWRADGAGPPRVLGRHEDTVLGMEWSPDGRRIATASADRTARVWSIDGSAEPRVLRGSEQGIRTGAFRPDGKQLATGSIDGTLRIWELDGAEPPRLYRGYRGEIYTIAWSPDGRRILAAGDDKDVLVWDVDRLEHPRLLRGHEQPARWAAWSPDSERIVTASVDATARIWRADGAGAPIVLRGHQAEVTRASFHPDGKLVLTASFDATAQIWNADGAGEPYVLAGHGNRIGEFEWSPDGAHVALTVNETSTAWVWPVRAPLRGPDDPRLWSAVPSCLSVERRMALLGVPEVRARAAQDACERRLRVAAE
jgi:WD40 repeat protein/serine/threonine protein kinase